MDIRTQVKNTLRVDAVGIVVFVLAVKISDQFSSK